MIFAVYLLVFFLLELIYFKIADKFNIIDHPNERSSHSTITLRGGGVIFPLALVVYAALNGISYPYFLTGLLLISILSFLDDLYSLSSGIRMFVQLIAVFFLAQQVQLFAFPIWVISIGCILMIGFMNACNFMDGINGITGLYSLVSIATIAYLNSGLLFVRQEMLIVSILALSVFLFFNFRKRAKCFAGDVGSVSIAYIILFALGSLIIYTGQFLYILFLAVYGIDTVLTIINRLLRKENIFKAHRSHAYQLLSNEMGISQLMVSSLYAAVQLLLNFAIIIVVQLHVSLFAQLLMAASILIVLSTPHILIVRTARSKLPD